MKHDLRFNDQLRSALIPLDLELDDGALSQLSCFWFHLCASSGRINLISPASLQQGPARHIGDSLLALRAPVLAEAATLLDVGSGGGLPGIPLALARPRLRVTLLEARERKAEWLRRTVRELDLADRIQVRCERFEAVPRKEQQGFDCLTARALAPPARAIPILLPALGPSATLLLWHTRHQVDEIAAALAAGAREHTYTPNNTYTHLFASINFSSHITEIHRAVDTQPSSA